MKKTNKIFIFINLFLIVLLVFSYIRQKKIYEYKKSVHGIIDQRIKGDFLYKFKAKQSEIIERHVILPEAIEILIPRNKEFIENFKNGLSKQNEYFFNDYRREILKAYGYTFPLIRIRDLKGLIDNTYMFKINGVIIKTKLLNPEKDVIKQLMQEIKETLPMYLPFFKKYKITSIKEN